MTAGLINNIKTHGVGTLSQLAFAVGQPGQPLQDAAIDNFIQAAAGRPPAVGESAILKRAAFEAQTFLIATLCFAGFSLRVCAVTRVGWVGGILFGAQRDLRNFLGRNSFNLFWRTIFFTEVVLDWFSEIFAFNDFQKSSLAMFANSVWFFET